MTNDAIIGHSGFVGGTLVHQHTFGGKFNSKNIDTIGTTAFDTVVCAAAPGSMFIANRHSDRDRAAIDALIAQLSKVRARRFILISSIAVLEDFAGGAVEDTTAFQEDLAYGHHRRLLEAFCESHFDTCHVFRLPALFGPGLKKNFVFDLMNPVPSMMPQARLTTLLEEIDPDLRDTMAGFFAPDPNTGMLALDRAMLNADARRPALDAAVREAGMSATQFHNPDSTFQYYDMARLWQDIGTAIAQDLRCVHLAVAPVRAADVHARLLGTDMPDTGAKLHREDMRTHHAHHWGGDGPYLEGADVVLDKLSAFFNDQRRAA